MLFLGHQQWQTANTYSAKSVWFCVVPEFSVVNLLINIFERKTFILTILWNAVEAAVIMTRTPRKATVRHKTETSPLQKSRQPPQPNKTAVGSNTGDEDPVGKEMTLGKPPITPSKSKLNSPETDVTPPKQRKSNRNSPCKTPRTPSTLLSKLALNSPPNEHSLGRKKLFSSHFQNARKALHSTVPVQMPGRERELEELQAFISGCVGNKSSSSLYISGPPGTGKTAALSVILEDPQVSNLKTVFVNCTAIKSSGAIYARISKELGIKVAGRTEKEHVAAIDNYLRKNHKMILLILDEIDQLDSKNQSVLYTIFEWPARPNSKLILIGIANALDLTDRILPRLQARCELKPKLMHFAPYSKQQLVQIFTERLNDSNVSAVFSPVAIQMLAGKVAAVSGDVRRALDIGRRVVELAEHQSNGKTVLHSVENLIASEERVDLKHVVSVLNNVYGTSQNLTDDSDDVLPLQQRIIICTLLLIMKKARNKDVTVGKLHEVYKRVCEKRNLSAVDQAEFVGLCSLIETRGVIRVSGKKEPRLYKVTLEWDEEEVAAALKDKQLMSSILQDDQCLGRL